MPNVFKFNTSTDEKSLRKGNFSIGVGDVPKGPSSVTGFYQGITPPVDGWMIYKKIDGDTLPFRIYSATQGSLVNIVNRIEGKTFSQIWECLNHYALTSSSVIVNKDFPSVVTDGLVFFYDASNTLSYPTTASVWYDISGNLNTGTMEGSPELSLASWFLFDGTDDRVTVPNSSSLQVTGDQTLEFLVRPDSRSVRRNWYEKSYGGEGTITYETNGSLTYFWGTAGVDNQPYQGVSTAGTPLAATGSWYHVILVRELSTPTKTVKWYINGVLNTSVSASYTAAVASTKQVQLGNGYTNRFIGGMAFARQYNKALSQAQVSQNYYGGPVLTLGLTLSLDASNLISYPATGTTWYNLVPSTINASLENGPVFTTQNLGIFTFDGSNDRALLSSSISLGNGNLPWTCTAWVKTSANPTGLGGGSVLSNSSGGPVYSMMGINSGKIVYWTYQNNAWTQKLGLGKTVNDNIWHFLSWVNYNNNTMDMYVDGVFDSNVANSTSGNNNPVNIIGASWAAGFNVSIGQLFIYNRSLASSEILQNFNATKWRFNV